MAVKLAALPDPVPGLPGPGTPQPQPQPAQPQAAQPDPLFPNPLKTKPFVDPAAGRITSVAPVGPGTVSRPPPVPATSRAVPASDPLRTPAAPTQPFKLNPPWGGPPVEMGPNGPIGGTQGPWASKDLLQQYRAWNRKIAPSAPLDEDFLRGQINNDVMRQGGVPARSGGPVDAVQPSVSPFELAVPGAALGGPARLGGMAGAVRPAAATAATATGTAPIYFPLAGAVRGYQAGGLLGAAGGLGTGALTGLGAAQVPGLVDSALRQAEGTKADATSRAMSPPGGPVGAFTAPYGSLYRSLVNATGYDPGLTAEPVSPNDPGVVDVARRGLGNLGRIVSLAGSAPDAAARLAGRAADEFTSAASQGFGNLSAARLAGRELAGAWEGVPGRPVPSLDAYASLPPGDPASLAAMGGLGAVGSKGMIDDSAAKARELMAKSPTTNDPDAARQQLVMDETLRRLRASGGDPTKVDQLAKDYATRAALPAQRDGQPVATLPSRADMDSARLQYGRVQAADPVIGAKRVADFERDVGRLSGALSPAMGQAPPAQAPPQPPPTDPGADRAAGFQSLRQRLGYTGAVPPAFAASVPAMNTVLDAAEKASVDPQDLVGGMQTAGKAIAAAAEDPKALARLEKAPPPHDFVQDVMKRPDVASGEVDPKEAVASAWAGMGSGARILLGAGLGTAALGLLMNLFGGDDEDGKGGSSFLWKVLPLLGLGAAAWGLASTDDITNPSFSRLADKKTWVGLGNDVGLGGLLGARR